MELCELKVRHRGVWLRVCDPATSGATCGRVRCSVLYHVAQLTCYLHGEEQVTGEMLLRLFKAWTYMSLDACPQRHPGAEFSTLLAGTDRKQQLEIAPRDVEAEPHVVESQAPTLLKTKCPMFPRLSSMVERPQTVCRCRWMNLLSLMSWPLFEILQHQSRMQQQDLGISARLRDNSVAVGLDGCSPMGCIESASSSCVATMCLQHCVDPSCAIRRHDGTAVRTWHHAVAWKVVVGVTVMIDNGWR